MISLPSDTRIWLVAGVTDMRKSFNGLGELIQHALDENPYSGHVFIFRGRKGDMVKVLVAAAEGYAPDAKVELRQAFSVIVSHFIDTRPLTTASLTLADYLHQRVQFCGRQLSWRQAIRTAVQPLIAERIVTDHYAEQIIEDIQNTGVTTYLTPQVLLFHAAPPAGVTVGALSLLKMKQSIDFGRFAQNLSPLLMVILVPSRDLSHIAILDALNRLIGNESALSTLLQASSLSAVQTCIETCWS